jgi:hypothetical protein
MACMGHSFDCPIHLTDEYDPIWANYGLFKAYENRKGKPVAKHALIPPQVQAAAEALQMSPGIVSGNLIFLTGTTGSGPDGQRLWRWRASGVPARLWNQDRRVTGGLSAPRDRKGHSPAQRPSATAPAPDRWSSGCAARRRWAVCRSRPHRHKRSDAPHPAQGSGTGSKAPPPC